MSDMQPSNHGPRYEMASVGHYLADLTPSDTEVPELGRLEAVVWTALGLVALIAFVGWLLVG